MTRSRSSDIRRFFDQLIRVTIGFAGEAFRLLMEHHRERPDARRGFRQPDHDGPARASSDEARVMMLLIAPPSKELRRNALGPRMQPKRRGNYDRPDFLNARGKARKTIVMLVACSQPRRRPPAPITCCTSPMTAAPQTEGELKPKARISAMEPRTAARPLQGAEAASGR